MYRLILFDVDGTFYNLEDIVSDNYNMQVDFFAEQKALSRENVRRLFEENCIFPYKSEHARSATEFFLRSGIDEEAWRVYRETHMPVSSIRRETAASEKLLKQFSSLTKLALLSSNTLKNIRRVLNRLEIDPGLFADIFCSTTDSGGKPFSKFTAVPFILSRYGLEARSVLCIGDRYESDIRPLAEMGGDGVLIREPKDLENVFQALLHGTLQSEPCAPYKFFCGEQTEGRVKE